MNHPLVTIVTPSYNQGPFIRQTIESVLTQDYPSIEYIIMDGGSTDETAAIAEEYSSRLRFVSERDRGQSHAINKGFQAARGQIVAWINSDDVLLPGAVTHAVRAFEKNPSVGAVYGEGYLIDRDGNVTGRFPATEKFNLWKLVYTSDYILQQTVYFRRAVFDAVGYLDEGLNWGMDWDILVRIAKLYGLEYVPEYMGCLREYAEAKTFSGGIRRFRELAEIMRRHGTMRYPPGYVTYGLDTYQNVACSLVERITPDFLEKPSAVVRKVIMYGAHRVIAHVLRECQGLYADGWAGPKLRYMVPALSRRIQMHGTLPAFGKRLDGQVLTIRCDGETVARTDVAAGDFTIEFARPADADLTAPATLDISASKFAVPPGDGRKLSFMLKSLCGVPAEARAPMSVAGQVH